VGGDRVDFFVSHAGSDRAWAEWVAWQLADAGFSVELDVWDWAAGQNFVTAMSDALDGSDRVVALFSAAYFDRSRYTTQEWTVAALHFPGMANRLVPVRVEDVPAAEMPAVLRPLVFRDVFGVDAKQARQVLLEAVAGPRRPDDEPMFPGQGTPGGVSSLGASGPRIPGSMPRVWSVPARNPGFTGRDGLLAAVRDRLLSGDRAVVQALQGMGGVGKTQLAVEYAHRFAGTYDLVWWVDAEQAGLVGNQFAALGAQLGCVLAGAATEAVRTAVLGELRERGRWLLVFDNAESPTDLMGWLPGGSGHVLITSRARGWAEIAAPTEVDVLARAESVQILLGRVAGLAGIDADRLAGQLGDLPLAVAQAAGFLAETGMRAGQYAELLGTRAGQILDRARPVSYPRSLAAAIQLSVEKLARDDPAAAALVSLCAFLAPEPIPEGLFTGAIRELPGLLMARAADPIAWGETLTHVTSRSLARIDQRGMQLHRLTQAVLRDRLTPAQAAATRALAEAILAASEPGDPMDPSTWPGWALLMPHLLAVDPGATGNPGLRQLACSAACYLVARGDPRSSHQLSDHLYQRWTEDLGGDDPHTLSIARYLAWALREMGRHAAARELDEDSLARQRRLRGNDHPDTLASAHSLAVDLRRLSEASNLPIPQRRRVEAQAARDLDADTLARRRRILGDDHPDTLRTANGLAVDLLKLGDVEAARDLYEETLARRRRALGDDHPDTLISASNLAARLHTLGEVHAARDLDADTLTRRRRVLGDDHPDTLRSASNLAANLRKLGDMQAARDLYADILPRRRRVLGDDHPSTLTTASNLATRLRDQGDASAARDLDQDTLARRRRVLGMDHPRTLTSASNLAADLRDQGDARAARDLDHDTLARRRHVLGYDHPDTLKSASNLAIDLAVLGETPDTS
jgi:tetratricopeptide (TPR) repeat protein